MMKTFKYILSTFLVISIIWSCTDDELNNLDFLDSAVAPTNVAALFTITQDNTGLVSIIPSADGAVKFDVEFGDGTENPASINAGEKSDHIYNEGSYTVNILAKGLTGLTTELSKDLVVSFQSPVFGTEPIVENDAAVSKQVNVTVPDDAQFALLFDVYFVEDGIETIVTGNVGEMVSYTYANAGIVDIKVVLKGGAIETVEFIKTDFEVTAIVQPIVSAPSPENRSEADYISIYSDAYNNVADSNYNPDWGQSGQGSSYAEFDLDGDKMLNYINLSYQGIDIGSAINAASMEMLHIDVWTADDMSIDIYPLPDGVVADDERFVTKTLVANEWNSFDIPLSEFTDQGLPLDNLKQFKFTGAPWAEGTVFIDNLYFHKTATEFANLPITFDSAIETFEPFLDAQFEITIDPEDVNNSVGKITNIGQGWGWEGVKLKLEQWIDVSAKPTIKLDFNASDLPHAVLMKLEDSTSPLDGNNNPTVFEEVWVDVAATGWNELIFNFISGGSYDTLVLFVDGGTEGIPGTYYFDNVVNEGTSTGVAPYSPIDFEADGNGADWTWSVFENDSNPAVEIVANPDTTGNTSSTVAKITALQAGQPWVGCESLHGADIGTFTIDETNKIVKIWVYKTVISDVGLKFATPAGGANAEIKVANTKINEWEEITFEGSSVMGTPNSIGVDQIIIFPDFNLDGRTSDNVVYFDNITFGSN